MDSVSQSGSCQEDFSYIHHWCNKYGLAPVTADAMYKHNINSAEALYEVTSETLQQLDISLGQRCLLRGALLQFRESDLQYEAFRAKKSDPEKAQQLERIHKEQYRKMDKKGEHGIM